MTLHDVMAELAARGNEKIKVILQRHGATEKMFGVKVGDMKPIARKLKGRQDLALELYATGNGDAQYLAGMVADGAAMTKRQVDQWARTASWRMVAGTTVPWIAVEQADGFALAQKWIDAKAELVAVAGWATLAGWVTVRPDAELDVKALRALLARVVKTIHGERNRVRQQMNLFVIALGTYAAPLADAAVAAARKIGPVEVDVGESDCQIPDAEAYIMKARRGAPVAPKRKTLRC